MQNSVSSTFRDEVLMARHMHKDVLAIFGPGQIQGEAK